MLKSTSLNLDTHRKSIMTAFSDFAAHGYQIIKELGHNSEGGRFTYLAKRLADNVDVVVKQFQFSKSGGWDGFRAIEREMQSLQGLNHRGIPKYLDKFETDSGYCLVTEYFAADTLAVGRTFTPDQIKQIAVQILEILVYLQERMPPIIHRDIKPENILVDDNLNVYLIDFGFARVGSGSVAMSSAAAGTFGFMAPEQIRNLQLTNASDLYGLGLTLICLIGAIRSTDIGNYIDFSNQLDRSKIDPKLKGCSLTFVKWLDQMVAPDPSKRFADAKIALEALKPLYVVRVPEVKFFKDGVEFDPSKTVLEFKATKLGEKLTQTITLVNSVPETILESHWEVAPHPNDPPHSPDNHAWISFNQKFFQGNRVNCEIQVDTSKLIAQSRGSRNLILNSNTLINKRSINIRVDTASLPVEEKTLSIQQIKQIIGVVVSSTIITYLGSGIIDLFGIDNVWIWILIGCLLTFSFSFTTAFFEIMDILKINNIYSSTNIKRIIYSLIGGLISGLVGVIVTVNGISNSLGANVNVLANLIILVIAFVLLCLSVKYLLSTMVIDNYKNYQQTLLIGLLFGLALGSSLLSRPLINFIIGNIRNQSIGFSFSMFENWVKSWQPFIYIAILVSGTALIYKLFYPSFARQRKIAAYRRKEEHLIKP